jgi:hypothetical protein
MMQIFYRRPFATFAFLLLATLSGCRSPATSPPVVIVNDTPITLAELQRTPEFYDFLDQYITAKMLQAAANEQGVSPTSEAVEAAERSEIQARFSGDSEAYHRWLAERGLTEDDFRQYIIRNLRREMLITRHLEPSDEEVRATFNAEKEYWRQYFSEMLRIPKDQLKDDFILQNLKKHLMYLRRSNTTEIQKILNTYRGWATRIVYPNAKPLPRATTSGETSAGQTQESPRPSDSGAHSAKSGP